MEQSDSSVEESSRLQSLGAATEKRRAAMSMLCGGTKRRLCIDDRKERVRMWADQISEVDRLMTSDRQITEIGEFIEVSVN